MLFFYIFAAQYSIDVRGKGPIAILLLLCFSEVLTHSMVPHHYHHRVISLSEYLYSTELYFRNKQNLLEYEHDLQVVEAELMRVFY